MFRMLKSGGFQFVDIIAKTEGHLAKIESKLAKIESKLTKTESITSKTKSNFAKIEKFIAKDENNVVKVEILIAKGENNMVKIEILIAKIEILIAKGENNVINLISHRRQATSNGVTNMPIGPTFSNPNYSPFFLVEIRKGKYSGHTNRRKNILTQIFGIKQFHKMSFYHSG